MTNRNVGGECRLLGQPLEEIIRVLIVALLVALSILLVSIFKVELRDYVFYMHFLYVPIVLSGLWWGQRGVVTAVVLAGVVLLTAVVQREQPADVFSGLIGAALFVIVALLVGTVSDEKNQALQKEQTFKLRTAHYFFNPLCIAEGNLDLALMVAPEDIQRELCAAQRAVERIKNVVINTVEAGEIRE